MDKMAGATAAHPLDDSRRRLEAVLNNATVAIFLMDERQKCIYMNHAAEKLTGFTLAEVLELDRPLHDIVHHSYPDGRPFPLSECEIDRAFPERFRVQGEEMFVHKDGSFYPVAFTASPIQDEESQTIGTIIEVRDVRDEKRAQERQRLLINELDHRVKNTLATVQSVAWQSFKHSEPEALQVFSGRLAALSNAHRILTDAAWESAPARQIVTTALEPFGLERFEIEGPDCEIHPKGVVTWSMVLHELGTNATKLGALGVASGMVAVRWTCESDAQATRLGMVWEESGGPPVSAPRHKGFGSRLIERQAGLEFGGKASLDFKPSGLVCRMQLELPAQAKATAAFTGDPAHR